MDNVKFTVAGSANVKTVLFTSGDIMTTIEEDLKRYRICRAEMDRKGGDVIECGGCPNDMPQSLFRLFVEIDHVVSGETP